MTDKFTDFCEDMIKNHERITPLNAKPLNEYLQDAAKKPPTKRLFGSLIWAKELSLMFGDSNVGKSMFAYAIAEQISGGFAFAPQFPTEHLVKVLYLDCELSQVQLYNRYKDYQFSQYFIRAETNTDYKGTTIQAIEAYLQTDREIELVIIDNLTYLSNEAENGSSAIELMHKLIEIKRKYDVGLLALAHVPKLSPKEALTQNSMSGSKHLANLADSIFAIGKSYKPNFEFLRYIKHLKCRNAEIDESTVTLIQLSGTQPFLHHEVYGEDKEYNHLKKDARKTENEEQKQQIIELSKQGKSTRQIGEQLGISHMTVSREIQRNTQIH